jgi:16S rRNA (uracil1498-N3)-methyltransferase
MQIRSSNAANRSQHALFFTEDLSTDHCTLDPEETNHAASVLRLKPEDPLQLTDGQGCRAVGIFETLIDRKMTVHIIERTTIDRRQPLISLFAGLPDRDAFESILLNATALGVSRIIPIATEFCQKKWWVDWEKLTPRFRRKMIVALKQSQSYHLPHLSAPCSTAGAASLATGTVLVADPDGIPLRALPPPDPLMPIACFIGPPGGFSAAECTLFTQQEFSLVKIAPARLRTELAATVLCAQLVGRSL